MNRLLLLLIGIAIGVGAMWVYESQREAVTQTPAPSAANADNEHDDDNDDGNGMQRIERSDQGIRVTLTAAEIALADVRVGTLAPARVTPETVAAGRVANIADLIGLLRDLRSAQATASAQQAVVASLAARLARLRALSERGEITVARELAVVDVEHRRAVEAGAVRQARVNNLQTALLARWGPTIAALAREQPAVLAPLEHGEAQLVEFVAEGAAPDVIHIAGSEDRSTAVPARVIGPAAETLGGARGASYLALANAATLRVGMPLTVWLPKASAPIDGVVLPASAVVWHRGTRWFFSAIDATHFARHAVVDALPYGADYLLPASQAPHDDVVLRGAQLLLAEEFRAQIPEEDDD